MVLVVGVAIGALPLEALQSDPRLLRRRLVGTPEKGYCIREFGILLFFKFMKSFKCKHFMKFVISQNLLMFYEFLQKSYFQKLRKLLKTAQSLNKCRIPNSLIQYPFSGVPDLGRIPPAPGCESEHRRAAFRRLWLTNPRRSPRGIWLRS